MGDTNTLFNMDPQTAQDLTQFGFSMAAASQQPGITFGAAAGKGMAGMNEANQQIANTQKTQLENQMTRQMMPYQLQQMKLKNKYLQSGLIPEQDNSPNSSVSTPYSPSAGGSVLPTVSTRPSNTPNGQNAGQGLPQATSIPPIPSLSDISQFTPAPPGATPPPSINTSTGPTNREQQQLSQLTRQATAQQFAGLDPKPIQAEIQRINDTIAARDKANIGIAAAGPQAIATKTGENAAEAQKSMAAINSTIDTQIGNLVSLKRLSDNMPYGKGADAAVAMSRNISTPLGGSGDYDKNWTDFNTMNKQMFVNGLMGSMPPGSRFDIPIVKSLQVAKEVDPYASPNAREAVIKRHIQTLLQAKQNAAKNYGMLTNRDVANSPIPEPVIPPQAATDHLVSHPESAPQFEQKYNIPASVFLGSPNGQ